MLKFLNLLRKKQPHPIPTIKPTSIHKKDDKKKHELFLIELEGLLKSSNLFKLTYIEKYLTLYKSYKAFVGKDYKLLSKQIYFFESLGNEGRKLTKSEMNLYAKNIILLANRRAVSKVVLNRFEKDGLFKEVILVFPNNELLCGAMIIQKSKYHNKKMPISKAPIFPLAACIKCTSCYHGVNYKPFIKKM